MPPTNRYPGTHPFRMEEAALFFGRNEEKKQLFDMVLVEKLVVLFGKSGIGKTSLLNAGLGPMLHAIGFQPIFIRLNEPEIAPERLFAIQYVDEAEKFSGMDSGLGIALPDMTLWELVKRIPLQADGKTFTPVLVLDQFEELFTRYDKGARQAFVTQLADLVSGNMPPSVQQTLIRRIEAGDIHQADLLEWEKPPLLKIILSIRWDMLSFLDEISGLITPILRARYHLQPLSSKQARSAIIEPARMAGHFVSPPFGWTEAALTTILGQLAKDEQVESFQLQLVCRSIEDKLTLPNPVLPTPPAPKGELAHSLPQVSPDFFGGKEGIEDLLKDFYLNQIDKLPTDQQQPARRLIEDELLTENGRRRSVDMETLCDLPNVDAALLALLVDMRLLRKEPRLGTFYYEISHDTLIAPVLSFKKERVEAAKRETERLENERKERELAAAQRIADEERALRERAEKNEQRAKERTRWAAVAFIMAVAFGLWAGINSGEANKSEKAALESARMAEMQTKAAQAALHAAQVEKAKRDELDFTNMERKIKVFLDADEPGLAQREYLKMEAIVQSDTLQPKLNPGLPARLEAIKLSLDKH